MARKAHIGLPPGQQPYDVWVGLRVGALAGGLIGAGIAALTASAWFIFLLAAAGGAVGFLYAQRAGKK